MTRWHVKVDGCTTQGDKDLAGAASALAGAYRTGATCEALVRGPQDSSFRIPTHDEAMRLVAAAWQKVVASNA